MKFEISDNKLEQVIFKYLDDKNFIIKETDDGYYFLEDKDDKCVNIVIVKNDVECFFYYELTEEIESFFSIETPMVKEVLTRYVENILNIEVFYTDISGPMCFD